MASPSEILTQFPGVLRRLQSDNGTAAIGRESESTIPRSVWFPTLQCT